MKTKFKYAIFVLVLVLAFTATKAQEPAIINDSVFSKVLNDIGNAYIFKGEYNNALNNLKESLRIRALPRMDLPPN